MASRDITGRIRTHTPTTYRLARARRRAINITGSNWETSTEDLTRGDPNEFDDYQLPWEEVTSGPQSLFRYAPPKVKYPAGIEDPNKIKFYKLTIDGFLRESQAVKQVLSGLRKHPFIDYPDLYKYAGSKNIIDYKFNTSKTQETIDWVMKENKDLGLKLMDLYNFGGIYSYSTSNEQIHDLLQVS